MEEMQKSMKNSIIFGIAGAVLLPVIYEIYANISREFALVLWLGGVVFAGIKFSTQKFRDAFLGITCTIAYSGIFGVFLYMFIHPVIKDFLTKRSVYFQLGLEEQGYFLLWIFLIMLIMYLISIFRLIIKSAFGKIKSNGEQAKTFVDNAFSDDEDEK